MTSVHPIPTNGRFQNIQGQRFGKLVVVSYFGPAPNGRANWLCRCDCGNVVNVTTNNLRSKNTKSCGCLLKPHGRSRDRVYGIWHGVIVRCTKPKWESYRHYGAKGVTVCERWRLSFMDFFEDMGEPPTDKHTIDRLDNEKGYEPGNCRWATMREQQNNRRNNYLIEYDGRIQSVTAWSREVGIDRCTIMYRISKGWSPHAALTTPSRKKL